MNDTTEVTFADVQRVLNGLIESCNAYDGDEFKTIAMELRDMLRGDDITVHFLQRAINAAVLGIKYTKVAGRISDLQKVKGEIESVLSMIAAYEQQERQSAA